MADKTQIESHRILYEDIKGDTELRSMIALPVLGGPAFAALNLTGHVIEGTAPLALSCAGRGVPAAGAAARCPGRGCWQLLHVPAAERGRSA